MELTSFSQIITSARDLTEKASMVVAAAEDEHTLEAAIHARKEGMVSLLLTGSKEKILAILAKMGESVPEDCIYDTSDLVESAEKAVALVREGKANFILKGKIDTKYLMKTVVNKENGLGKGDVMSHFTIFEVPGCRKLVCPVDGGMVPYPTLEQKKAIIENTVRVYHALGCECPKVGVLSCVEKLNPKMPETVEADELKQMYLRGEISGCIVEGPISYDCAMSKEIADFKGYESPCAGDCDILVAPNIHAGNIMGKMLTVTMGAKMAGFIVGAKCPIAMVSRGASPEEKYLSIVFAAYVAKKMEEN